mmetsp:Transcript_5173/g.12848  ORF Transcript_5173/g.12848 Transcript_5173/m.12848 type:complete len:257 (+) Transcript_5173:1197-1967(+)
MNVQLARKPRPATSSTSAPSFGAATVRRSARRWSPRSRSRSRSVGVAAAALSPRVRGSPSRRCRERERHCRERSRSRSLSRSRSRERSRPLPHCQVSVAGTCTLSCAGLRAATRAAFNCTPMATTRSANASLSSDRTRSPAGGRSLLSKVSTTVDMRSATCSGCSTTTSGTSISASLGGLGAQPGLMAPPGPRSTGAGGGGGGVFQEEVGPRPEGAPMTPRCDNIVEVGHPDRSMAESFASGLWPKLLTSKPMRPP